MYSPQNRRNYYYVLGIDKNANIDQIKKAYKRMAIKWHPDKNLDNKEIAQQKFREISEAYQILSDERKKNQYDNYGYQPKRTSRFSKFNYEDADNLFKNFFKSSSFDSTDDEAFFSAFNRKKNTDTRKKYGFNSMFDDQNFWSSSLGKGNKFASFGATKLGSPGKLKRTVNTVKQIVNGKLIITKTTTIVRPDGSKKVTEQKTDEQGQKIGPQMHNIHSPQKVVVH